MKKVILAFVVLILISSSYIASAENSNTDEKPEKITFIHYKDGSIKPENNGKPTVNTCYKLLGVQWPSTPVNYVINPTNPNGLPEAFVTNAIFLSAEEWDKYTSKELFNNVFSIDYSANWDDVAPDGRNEYSFGLYPQNNVIAVTNVWMARIGKQKAIVEYDVLFNTYYTWGDATSNSNVMDLQNIATHETGHGVGLADLYNTCTQETMYGYSNFGEISKRNLNTGDIAGIKKLYG